MKHRAFKIAIAMLLGGGYHATEAVESFGETPQETALCSALVYGGKDKQFNSKMEPDIGWGHAHHWCDCVRFRYRAIRSIGDKTSFSYNAGQALQGCDYVIRAVNPGSRLLPKVLVDKGRVLKLRGEAGAAAQEFQRAITLGPGEIQAYGELSQLQEEGGQKTAARETIVLGLQHNPGSKLLQKRYLELGGKEPFPEAVAQDRTSRSSPPQGGEEPPSGSVELQPADPVVAVEVLSETLVKPEEHHSDNGKSAEDGSARSCRFCPPEEIQQRWIESFKSNEKMPQ